MTSQMVLTIGRDALTLLLMISMPVLGVVMAVGLLVSIFQAVTQIHEATLAFVPKLIAAMVAGHLGVGLVMFLALLPVAAIAAALYFMSGMALAVAAGVVLAAPVVVAAAGMLGTYRSSVWTLGYMLEARG